MFNIPDLYDPVQGQAAGLGGFDIMSSFNGSGNQAAPGSLSPWSKMQLEWMTPREITADGIYSLEGSSTASDAAFIIRHDFPDEEYLLIENRRPTGFDANIVGDGGLLIYHIDDSLGDTLQSRAGFNGQAGWPQNGNHYRIALVQSDGRFDLEQNLNRGDEGDYWLNSMVLGPGGNGIFPNTDSYQLGQIARTGITITVLSPSADQMFFSVTGIASNPVQVPPSPAPTPAPVGTGGGTPTPPSGPSGPAAMPTPAPVGGSGTTPAPAGGGSGSSLVACSTLSVVLATLAVTLWM